MTRVAAALHRLLIPRRRTPHIAQVEEADCGAACLSMVLAAHGRHVSHHELRAVCGGGRDGLSGTALARAAATYGLAVSATRVRLRGERSTRGVDAKVLRSVVAGPAIASVRGRHFVVLDSVSPRGRLVVLDPAGGRTVQRTDEFVHTFAGVVVALTPGPDFRTGGARPSARRDVTAWLGAVAPLVAFAILAGVGAAAGSVAAAFAVRHVIQSAMSGAASAATWVLALAALTVAATTWSYQRLLSAVLRRLALDRSDMLVGRLLRLPSALVHRSFTGALAARVQAADTAAMQITNVVVPAIVNLAVLVVVATVLVAIAPTLAAIALVNVALAGVLLRQAARGDSARQSQLLAAEVSKDGITLNGLTMPEILKAEGAAAGTFEAWANAQRTCLDLAHRSARWTQWHAGPATALASVTSVLVLVIGAILVVHGRLTMGDLIATVALVGVLGSSAGAVGQSGLGVARLRAALAMVNDITDDAVSDHPSEHPSASPLPTSRPRQTPQRRSIGELVLDNVTFGYDTNRPPLLDAVSLRLGRGERLTVVGRTGGGKSTLAKLAAGVAEPWAGTVLLDGRPVHGSASQNVGYVAQKPLFLEGTVAENVALGAVTIDHDALIAALLAAEIADVVDRRGGPFAAAVSQGGDNFSGGERQRLALARALYRRPSVLVLDEATSALDGPLARRIDDSLRRLGITTLAVAHRLDAVRPGDRILAVDAAGVRELTSIASPGSSEPLRAAS